LGPRGKEIAILTAINAVVEIQRDHQKRRARVAHANRLPSRIDVARKQTLKTVSMVGLIWFPQSAATML